jgi:hypothetical protein
LLHVGDGRAVELEIYRLDGEAIQYDGVQAPRMVMVAQ